MTSKNRGGEDVGNDDPLLVGTVPARTSARSRAAGSNGNGASSRADAAPSPRAEDFEVPARKNDRLPDDSELIWAVSAPVLTGEPTGAIDTVAAEVATDLVEAPADPIVVVPAVIPADVPPPPLPVVVPTVVTPPRPKVQRKQQPKVVRLPRRPRVRKVSRVVRSIDAWTVFKVSIVFYLAMYVVFVVAGVLLWNVAYSTGTIDNVSGFFESFGWERFEFKGGEIYHNAWIIGLFVVAGLTGLNVVLATLYNLITDLVGGVRLTILEEEVVVRVATPSTAGRRPTSAVVVPTRKDRRRARRVQSRISKASRVPNTARRPNVSRPPNGG